MSDKVEKRSARALTYVLITPARNEAEYIELTLKSVVSQTVLPLKWIIVSDGSTDGTDDIVHGYTSHYPWIELLRMPERAERYFGGKVRAFNAGYEKVKGLRYDIIGNVDADISFDPDYLEFLLSRFAENPELGVAGTPFREGDYQYDFRFVSVEHVSGGCQLFRRPCFEEIGGFLPLKSGGVDLMAVTTARMKGWQTRTFLEKPYFHHRKMGTADRSLLMAAYKSGRADYMLGVHPVWQFVRFVYQIKHRPYFLYGAMLLAGFVWAMLTGVEKTIPDDLVSFRRKEQMQRLRNLFRFRRHAVAS